MRQRLGHRHVDLGHRGSGRQIPEETAGPYPVTVRTGLTCSRRAASSADIRSSLGDATGVAEGVPMTLGLSVSDLADGGSALAGAAVYLWHCDRDGKYSPYSEGVEEQNYLRGVQITDSTHVIATSRVALPRAVCDKVYAATGYDQPVRNLSGLSLAADNVFGDDGASLLATVTGNLDDGYSVKLAVRVDTSTAPNGGGAATGARGNPPGAPAGSPPDG